MSQTKQETEPKNEDVESLYEDISAEEYYDAPLEVVEIFVSLQGEGPMQGLPEIFIRVAGCNLNCDYCDSKYAHHGKVMSVNDIMAEIVTIREDTKINSICITGGEPLIHANMDRLLSALSEEDFHIVLETNGTQNIESFPWVDCFVCDYKFNAYFHPNNYEALDDCDCLKFVVGEWKHITLIPDIVSKLGNNPEVHISPIFDDNNKCVNAQAVADGVIKLQSLMPFTCVKFVLQIHKIVWPEKTRGI